MGTKDKSLRIDKWLMYVKEKNDREIVSGWEVDIPSSYVFCQGIKVLAKIIEEVEKDNWEKAKEYIPLLWEKVATMLLLAPQYIHQYLLDKAEKMVKDGYEKGREYQRNRKFLCNAIDLFAMYMKPSFDSEMLYFYGEIAGCLDYEAPIPPPP